MISWNGAFLYDSSAGAETVIQLLEYANSQLLEFRHYDELLTRELQSVYDFWTAAQPESSPAGGPQNAPAACIRCCSTLPN